MIIHSCICNSFVHSFIHILFIYFTNICLLYSRHYAKGWGNKTKAKQKNGYCPKLHMIYSTFDDLS